MQSQSAATMIQEVPALTTGEIQIDIEAAGLSSVRRIAVVGGGVSGVVTARIFLQEGFEVTLFESAGSLAGVWRENYQGYGVQTPAALYEFPDEPLPPGSDFTKGPVMAEYIQSYAKKHGVAAVAQLEAEVLSMEQV